MSGRQSEPAWTAARASGTTFVRARRMCAERAPAVIGGDISLSDQKARARLPPVPTRRDFIVKSAWAAAALYGSAAAKLASASVGKPPLSPPPCAAEPPYAMVYDSRFVASTDFAASAVRLGARMRDLDEGDVTRLWYYELHPLWQRQQVAIAGLTTHEAMIVLEGFGRVAGLRLVFSAEHAVARGEAKHALLGTATLVTRAESALRTQPWTTAIAKVLTSGQSTHREAAQHRATHILPAGPADLPVRLHSWLLAPVRQSSQTLDEATA